MIDITLVDFILIVGQKMKFGLLECTPDLFINLAELILIQMKQWMNVLVGLRNFKLPFTFWYP